ncbi:MAG: choice-of-anchor D domain-containing protein [Terriglobia bacterium]
MRVRAFLLAACLTLELAPALLAQNPPFQLFIQDPKSNSTAVTNGSSITVSADALNQPVTITLSGRYTGVGAARITGPAEIVGSGEFTADVVNSPQLLLPGSSFSVNITFNPTITSAASAQILVPYSETDAKNAPLSAGSIGLNLLGTAPNLFITYLFASDQNVIQLKDGDTLPFPATPVAGVSVATIAIQNQGSGPGPITSVKLTGSAFTLQGLPLLPGTLSGNSALQFSIRYQPTKAQQDKGTLQVVFSDRTVTVSLTGAGTTPTFSYQLVQNGQASPITPGQSIDIPPVVLASPTTFSVVVTNTGNAPGTIVSAAIIGPGFQITDSPAFPLTLAPNDSATIAITLTAAQGGSLKAQLRIGADTFILNGSGLGPQLSYSYSNGAGTTPILQNGFVVFSPVQLGQSASTIFTIKNSGTAPATVASINLQTAKSPYSLLGLPNLPVTIAANSAVNFTILFTPAAAGPNPAVLLIDATPFNLSGSGNPPPTLPAFQFTGASGTQQPLQQPSVGLTLTSAYTLPITGSVAITQVPDGFSPDPAVQFATGGQAVAFTIPANTLQAVFPNGATSVKLQTGSVSGTITLTPTFASNGIDLTPASPPTVRLTVPAAAPQLVGAQLIATAANGFTVQTTGVATSRKLTKLHFTFTAAPKFNLASAQVLVDVTSLATSWFQSAQSTPFGGQFLITVPFTLTSSESGGVTAGTLQSVSVTIDNDLGTSNAVTAQLQ